MQKIFLILICTLSTLYSKAQSDLDSLDRYINEIRELFKSPGMSVAIVSNNEVVYNKGFGTRTLGKNEPVDTETQFAIGSITKSFTPVALAMLVDEGKLDWDDKVVHYIPSFELYNHYVTSEFTIRDLLTHKSGLKSVSGGTLFYHSDLERDEIIKRMKYLKPVSGFRTEAAYQNIMFVVAAKVVEIVSGNSWEYFIKNRIFAPLGMNRTLILEEERKKSRNIASAHIKNYDLEIIPIEQEKLDNIAPAGSFYSTSTDMAKYMMFIMNNGVFEGDTLIQPSTFEEILKPQTYFQLFKGLHNEFTSYGFGWWLTPKNGHKIIEHSGGVDGASANVIMVQDINYGVVVLNNASNWGTFAGSIGIIGNKIHDDDYLRNEKFIKENANRRDSIMLVNHKAFLDSKIKNTKPSLALSEYTGTFSDKMYGNIIISLEKGNLNMVFEHTKLFSGSLSHWHYDTFKLGNRDARIPDGLITFEFNSSGEIIGFNIDQPNLLDVDFSEVKFNKVSAPSLKQH